MKQDQKTKPVQPAGTDYHQLFSALKEPYLVFAANDPTFTLIAENDAHAKIALVTPDEIIGRSLFEVFPDTSDKFVTTGVSDLAESIRRVISTGKPDKMETFRYDIKASDGSFAKRYWRVVHNPVFDSDHNVHVVYQATQDVTEEIVVGSRLASAQHQLDAALAIGKIGAWVWNITTNKLTADKNLADMFGVSAESAQAGLPLSVFTDAIYEDDRQRIEKQIARTVKKQGTFEEEYRTIGHDGTLHWVIARGRIEVNENEDVTTFPGVLVDITERKQAEINLQLLARASELLANSLQTTATLATISKLFVPDVADWCTIDLLDEAHQLQLVGLAHKDPKKVAWAKAYRAKRPPKLDDTTGVGRVLRSGKSEYYPLITDELLEASAQSDEELRLARELELSSVIIAPLTVQDKTVGAITLIATGPGRHYTKTDVRMVEDLAARASLAMTNAHLFEQTKHELAERRRLEQALRSANEELEARVLQRTAELQDAVANLNRSNQELQDFAYVASHDLQEPLRKIQAFGNLLEDEYGQELGDGLDYLQRMRNAAARMSTLITDLLSFSRVTTKAHDFEPVKLRTITEEVLSDLETRVKDTHAVVTLGALPTIDADPLQMRQLFQNLIGNALKFYRPGVTPEVTITAEETERQHGLENATIRYCTIRVSDNGVGFDEKYLDRIFAVFQRLHGREEYEGTGIGLAVCRKIAERHGGTITAESAPGKGATFVISIPSKQNV